MVTQAFGDSVCVIGLIGFQAKDLGGTRLGRDFIRCAGKVFMRGTVASVGYAIHPVFSDFPKARVNVSDRRFMRLNPGNRFTVFHRALQQMRYFNYSVVNQDHQRLVHLNRRCGPVALTDPDWNGIALVPRFLEALEFPFASRHITGALFRQVNAGIVAVAKFTHPLRQAVDAHIIGNLIEVGIGGLFQRFGDIQMAVAPLFPVTVAFFRAGKLPPAGVKQAGVAGYDPGAER